MIYRNYYSKRDFNVQWDTSLNNFTSSSITDNGTTTTIGWDFNVQWDIYQWGTVFSGWKFVNGNNVADAVTSLEIYIKVEHYGNQI